MPETLSVSDFPGIRAERFKVIAAIGPSVSIETLKYLDIISTIA